ncbi:MAG: hypothetical protein M1616_04430 [Candidatus Thermoplasmatota archaeon]|nr:hypothetical protein [Candidatus Thermoplasmatota archaeon]
MGRRYGNPGMDDGQCCGELIGMTQMAGTGTNNHFRWAIASVEAAMTAFLLLVPAMNQSILIDDRGFTDYLFVVAFFTSVPLIFIFTEYMNYRFYRYFGYLQIFNAILLLLMFLYHPEYLVFAVLIFAFSIISFNGILRSYGRFLAFTGFSFFMYYLGESLQFISQPLTAPVTVVPLRYIYIFPGQPLPWIYSSGVNIYGSLVTMTLSPLIILIFTSISILAVDNFYGIFRILSGNGNSGMAVSGVQGIATSLSCQCEGCIGLLPSVAAAIVTIAMIPLILESWVLLLMTNLILWFVKSNHTVFYGKFTEYVKTVSRAILMAGLLILPSVSTFAVYMGYFKTPLFIFGTSMAGAFLGYLIGSLYGGYILRRNTIWAFPLLIAGSLAIFLWFVPVLTALVLESFPVYALMSLTTITGGIAAGSVRKVFSRGYLVSEFLSLAMGIFSLLIFYVGLEYRFNPWPFFSLSSVLVFEIAAWGTMVPLMWVATQSTIATFFTERFILSENTARVRKRNVNAQNHI